MSRDNPLTPASVAVQTPPARHTQWKLLAGLAAGVLVFLALACCGFLYFTQPVIKSLDVVQEAVKRATSTPAVVSQLGTPIKTGWLVTGSITWSNSSGDADLAIPISGPKGKGTIDLTAHKSKGTWTYSVLEVVIDGGGEKIDLLSHVNATWLPETRPAIPASASGTACYSDRWVLI
jgi:hypothetical protein